MAENKQIKLHEIVVPTSPLPVWYFIFNTDTGVPKYVAPHWHRGIELSYTLDGRITDFIIAGKHFDTQMGQILVVNTQVIHSVDSTIKKGSKTLSIIFPFDYVANLYPEINHQEIDINYPEKLNNDQKLAYSNLQGLLTQFYWLASSTQPLKNLKMQQIVDEVLLLLLERFTKEKPPESEMGQRKVYVINRLQFITQYVNNHYQEKLTLDSIAKKCNVSKEYLSRFFKKQMEITVDTYINNVRAQRAYFELKNTSHNLTQIAMNNGFSGVRTMNRAFDKLYGKTASQIKRNFKNQHKKRSISAILRLRLIFFYYKITVMM